MASKNSFLIISSRFYLRKLSTVLYRWKTRILLLAMGIVIYSGYRESNPRIKSIADNPSIYDPERSSKHGNVEITGRSIVLVKAVLNTFPNDSKNNNLLHLFGMYNHQELMLGMKPTSIIKTSILINEKYRISGFVDFFQPTAAYSYFLQKSKPGCFVRPIYFEFALSNNIPIPSSLSQISLSTSFLNAPESAEITLSGNLETYPGVAPESLGPEGQMGVCLMEPMYLYSNWATLIEILELWRSQSFNLALIPLGSVSKAVQDVLDIYQEIGFVELSSWGSRFPAGTSETFPMLDHVLGYMQSALVNYCSWVLQSRVRFMAVIDLDEVLTPNNIEKFEASSNPMGKYFEYLLTKYPKSASFSFLRPVAQLPKQNTEITDVSQIHFTRWKRLKVAKKSSQIEQRKYMSLPNRCKVLNIHWVYKPHPKFTDSQMEENEGVILHLRDNLEASKHYKASGFRESTDLNIFTKLMTQSFLPDKLKNRSFPSKELTAIDVKDVEKCQDAMMKLDSLVAISKMTQQLGLLKSLAKGVYELAENIENEVKIKVKTANAMIQCEIGVDKSVVEDETKDYWEVKYLRRELEEKEREIMILREKVTNANQRNIIETERDVTCGEIKLEEPDWDDIPMSSQKMEGAQNRQCSEIDRQYQATMQDNIWTKLGMSNLSEANDKNEIQCKNANSSGSIHGIQCHMDVNQDEDNDSLIAEDNIEHGNYVARSKMSGVFKCKFCFKAFSRNYRLMNHLREQHSSHDSGLVYVTNTCKFCGKSFTTSSNLLNHMRKHTGEKPYECPQCGKTFTQRGNLTTHMNIHAPKKPFVCEDCGKQCAQKNNLFRHIAKHHRYINIHQFKMQFNKGAITPDNSFLNLLANGIDDISPQTANEPASPYEQNSTASFTDRKASVPPQYEPISSSPGEHTPVVNPNSPEEHTVVNPNSVDEHTPVGNPYENTSVGNAYEHTPVVDPYEHTPVVDPYEHTPVGNPNSVEEHTPVGNPYEHTPVGNLGVGSSSFNEFIAAGFDDANVNNAEEL